MRLSTIAPSLTALALLGGLLACGGAYTPPPGPAATATPTAATSLTYTDPATTGWRLVKDVSSTPTHLVLNLVGPTGLKARGVGFNLSSDGTVKFHKFTDSDAMKTDNYLKDTGVFQLKFKSSRYSTDLSWMLEPVIFAGGTKNGGKLLTVGIYQKDRAQSAQSVDTAVLQIGIDLPATGGPASGSAIPLTLVRARIIPEDIGQMPAVYTDSWSSVLTKFRMEDIQIAVGALKAQ